MKQALCT